MESKSDFKPGYDTKMESKSDMKHDDKKAEWAGKEDYWSNDWRTKETDYSTPAKSDEPPKALRIDKYSFDRFSNYCVSKSGKDLLQTKQEDMSL